MPACSGSPDEAIQNARAESRNVVSQPDRKCYRSKRSRQSLDITEFRARQHRKRSRDRVAEADAAECRALRRCKEMKAIVVRVRGNGQPIGLTAIPECLAVRAAQVGDAERRKILRFVN